MNCSPFDLRDYFFGELNASDRRQVEVHLDGCASCREEMASLGVMRSALLTVRDEEPPRRIAFVSDKVFEPRWWQVWASGPRAGLASAALLAAAIFAHGLSSSPSTQPLSAGQAPVAATAAIDRAAIDNEVQSRIDAAVRKASADLETRYESRLRQIVAEQRRELEFEHRANLVSMQEYADTLQKRMRMFQRASYDANSAGAAQ